MLEKEAWSNEADNVFCSEYSKSINKLLSIASDGIKTSVDSFMDTLPSGGELSGNESIQSETTFAVSDSVNYQDRFPEANNNHSFVDNSAGKDSNDILGYCWDDFGNFEDVDRMFRSCDSTFGLGTSPGDDLGRLSLSDAIGESEDVLKSDFNLACPDSNSWKSMSESEDTSRSNGMTCSINDSEVRNSSDVCNGSGQLGILSLSNGTSYSGGTDNKDMVIPKGHVNDVSLGVDSRNVEQQKMSNAVFATNKMIDESIKHMKLPNKPGNHKNDQYVENSSFFDPADCSEADPQPIKTPDSHSFGNMHSDSTFISSDYCFPSDQNSMYPAQSGIKSEKIHLTSVSAKGPSVLNQMQAAMYSQASSPQVISFAEGENDEWKNRPKNLQASASGIPESNVIDSEISMSAITSTKKPIHYSGKCHSDGVNEGVHQESGSSVAQDSSRSSALDDISMEATSFRQLQLVMEQLDERTKLCIRDSLYRLARSAEQRHQYVKLSGGPIVDRDSMLTQGSTKYPVFVDMETNTNPIDRSIAHLLFHRPADSQVLAGRGSSPWSPSIQRSMDPSTVRL